jgi:EAL and modified HD-GYP domain-containing signal transduction protein
MENDLLFARQPIFDARNKLYGYELLYRNIHPNAAVFDDGNKATSELLINYCAGILNDESCPYVKIFINFTRRLILSDYFVPLESSRIVVEILENTEVDDRLVEKVKSLKAMGYEFALDDYNFSEEFDPLIPFVDYIKVDLTRVNGEQLTQELGNLNQRVLMNLTRIPRFVAEKVEQQSQYEFCKNLNFELFQGYFLERPQLVYGKKINNSAETALQIVAQLQEPNLEIDDLCHAVSRDTKLSYKLLKIVNSPLYRLPKKVSSLKEAIVILGLEQVKKWAMALVLSGDTSKSSELFRILLTRARACEIYATEQGYESPDKFFTVGLFSGIDAIMLADKKWLIESLELSQDMNDAIIEEKGQKGEVLKLITALEHGNFSVTNRLSNDDRIELFSAHETAIDWTNDFYENL